MSVYEYNTGKQIFYEYNKNIVLTIKLAEKLERSIHNKKADKRLLSKALKVFERVIKLTDPLIKEALVHGHRPLLEEYPIFEKTPKKNNKLTRSARIRLLRLDVVQFYIFDTLSSYYKVIGNTKLDRYYFNKAKNIISKFKKL